MISTPRAADAVSGTPSAGSGTGGMVNRTDPGGTMGQDLFLKLLVTQLKYQDPLEPTDSKEMMSQLAQFSSVEGLNAVNKQLTALGIAQDFTASLAMIGKTVAYTDEQGTARTGTVQGVRPDGSGTILKLSDGTEIRSGDVEEVR